MHREESNVYSNEEKPEMKLPKRFWVLMTSNFTNPEVECRKN
jgi:hypothetical protein